MEVVGNLVVIGVYDVSAEVGDVIGPAAAAVGLFAKRRPILTSADFEAFSTNLKKNLQNTLVRALNTVSVSIERHSQLEQHIK